MDDDETLNIPEVTRLRAIGAWMREVGALELELDGLRIQLSASPPVAPGRPMSESERIEREALTDEQRAAEAASEAEREHNAFWKRVTRASGAPIPPFKRSA